MKNGVPSKRQAVSIGRVFKALANEAFNNSEKHGFHEKWESGSKIALIHSEVSEMLECLRDDCQPFYIEDDGKPEGTATEAADVIIRVLDFAEYEFGHELLTKALLAKLAYNRTRPHKHGRKF